MTEKEYINLENLTKVRTLLTLTRDLMPDEKFTEKDQNEIIAKLMDWRDTLQKKVKVK